MLNVSCASCVFWDPLEPGAKWGDCRARCPTPDPNGIGQWPMTDADDWCGDHSTPRTPTEEK
jgi:hypothetical protein